MKILLACFIILSSCSFKKNNDDVKTKTPSKNPLQSVFVDSDGDGVTDQDEASQGSDPFIADIPTFSGDFFEEMSVKLEVYNKLHGGYDTIEWKTKDAKTKNSWEEIERVSEKGGLYMEALMKNYAAINGFQKNNFKFYDYNEGIFSYSSPLMFEDDLFSISEKLLSFQRNGFEINRAEVTVLSQFQITSKKYVSFRNPVFDIYYKSINRDGLIFVESKRIDGTYSFNEENKINIHFESYDPKIINEGLLSSGSSFFIKLRDFTVYETNENYAAILEKVQINSVPVTISYSENGEDRKSLVETIYVGTNGRPETLNSILNIAFKQQLLMTPTSIDQIRGLSNRSQSYGETGQNESMKWYVGSSHIDDNVYSYLFKPNEGIGLAYISDKKALMRPIYVSRTTLDTTQISANSGKLPTETQNIKIKFVPQKFLIPVENYESIVLPNCPRGNWETNQVTYKKVTQGWQDSRNIFDQSFPKDGHISIKTAKGSILDGNISALIKEKLLIAEKDDNNSFSLSLSTKISQQLQKERSQPSVEVSIKPSSVTLNLGAMTEVGRVCIEVREGCDCAGHGGGNGGGHMKSGAIHRESFMQGFGMGEDTFRYKYDLDIHFFSY
jgi:hypothetical protein